MITAAQLLAHGIGDYMLQSDWMAINKTKDFKVALIHASAYSIPFLFLAPSLWAILIIVGSHALIDRYRLAKYICYAKNWLAPKGFNTSWNVCKENGYDPGRPVWLTTWLFIITDNLLHIMINGLALKYLP